MTSLKSTIALLAVAVGLMFFASHDSHSQTTAPVTTFCSAGYTVSNPAAFPGLSYPNNALIFRNGLKQRASRDYTLNAAGTSFQLIRSYLSAGDSIEVDWVCQK